MFEQIIVPMIAGLFPSLITIIPMVVTMVKNVKVNKQVDMLLETVEKVKSREMTVGQAVDANLKGINEAMNKFHKDFENVAYDAKEAITKDVIVMQDKVESTIHTFEQQMSEVSLAIAQAMERWRLENGDVPKVSEETQDPVHSE